MIDYFRTIDELDKEEFNKEEKEESEEIYNRTVRHEPIDFGLGSVTYWGVSRFLFSIILVLITVLPVFSQDMYSHMVDPMILPQGYGEYHPVIPYYNPCYHTDYNDFYLKQLYYDSVYKYIYDRTHSNNLVIPTSNHDHEPKSGSLDNFTIRRTN